MFRKLELGRVSNGCVAGRQHPREASTTVSKGFNRLVCACELVGRRWFAGDVWPGFTDAKLRADRTLTSQQQRSNKVHRDALSPAALPGAPNNLSMSRVANILKGGKENTRAWQIRFRKIDTQNVSDVLTVISAKGGSRRTRQSQEVFGPSSRRGG